MKSPNDVPIKNVAPRLNVLKLYLKQFPKPENMSFSSGEMIDVVIGINLNSWCKIMAQSRVEPREMEFEKSLRTLRC